MASKELTDLSIQMATQPKEQAIQTSAGMETATQTADRIKGALGASNVPVSMLDNNVPEVQLPDAPTVVTDTGVVNEGKTLLDQETARAQQAANQATQTVSDSERQVRELFGMTQTEADTRTKLEERAGIDNFAQDLRQFQESLRRQVAQLDQFDIDNVNTIERMRVDASKRDITKRTFNAMSAEANIQNAVKRANMVAQTRATIAAIDVTQGNLEAATQQVDKALNAIYEPIRQQLQMEMFFLERNDKRFDATQRDLANVRMMQIQREQAQMDRAVSMVDSAVASGYATGDDIRTMTSLSGNPEAQVAYAQSIVAKGAIQQRLLSEAVQRASIDSSRASAYSSQLTARTKLMELALAGDQQAIQELGFDPGALIEAEESAVSSLAAEKEIERLDKVQDTLNRILGNNVGLTTSSGEFRNATISGLIGGQIMNQQQDRGKVGQVVGTLPVVGNFVNSVSARQQKSEWLADVGQILTDQGFEALIDINERVRLTPITEVEVALAFKSASALQNAAIFDGEGENRKLVGFSIPEDRVREEFAKMMTATQKVQEEVAAIEEFGYSGYVRLQQLQATQQ